MNTQKLIVATLVGTVVYFGISYVWYELLMADYFTEAPGMRDPFNFPLIILGSLIFMLVFVYIYPKGVSDGTKVKEGAMFGLVIALLTTVPMTLIMHAVQDYAPFSERAVDAIFNIVLLMIVGIVVAYVTGIPGHGSRGAGGPGPEPDD